MLFRMLAAEWFASAALSLVIRDRKHGSHECCWLSEWFVCLFWLISLSFLYLLVELMLSSEESEWLLYDSVGSMFVGWLNVDLVFYAPWLCIAGQAFVGLVEFHWFGCSYFQLVGLHSGKDAIDFGWWGAFLEWGLRQLFPNASFKWRVKQSDENWLTCHPKATKKPSAQERCTARVVCK